MLLEQDGVAESDRCVVGGVQNSIQSMMDLMTYIMAILISNPKVMVVFSSSSRASFIRWSSVLFVL